jgi:hypothetical protein
LGAGTHEKGNKTNGAVMKYLIAEANSARDLQAKVQQYIEQGWEPIGGLSVATYGVGSWWYYQALIKREHGSE